MTKRQNMTFKERLAWLGRMPTRWRVLIGGQAIFFAFAIKVRLSDIERGRKLLEEQKRLESIKTDQES
jgi:hypothetical protein